MIIADKYNFGDEVMSHLVEEIVSECPINFMKQECNNFKVSHLFFLTFAPLIKLCEYKLNYYRLEV